MSSIVAPVAPAIRRRDYDGILAAGPYYFDGIDYDATIWPERGGRCIVKEPGQKPQVGVLTDFFTFTGDANSMYRAASGLLVPSQLNTPRIEYDAAGSVLGLFIEGSRANSILRSADFGTTWNLVNGTMATNTDVAPDGTVTADRLIGNGNSACRFNQNIAWTAAAWTASCFVKAGTATRAAIGIEVSAGIFSRVIFNIVTGSFVQVEPGDSAPLDYGIVPYGNGWFRIYVTATASAASLRAFIYNVGVGNQIVGGNVATDVFVSLWGFQAELGASPSSYLPTTTSSVTRAAEGCARTLGAEFNATSGTLYAETISAVNGIGDIQPAVRIGDAVDGFWLQHYHPGSNKSRIANFTSGVAVADLQIATPALNTINRLAGAYAANDFAGSQNGSVPLTDTSGALGTPTTMHVGVGTNSSMRLYGHVRRFSYRRDRMPNPWLSMKAAA